MTEVWRTARLTSRPPSDADRPGYRALLLDPSVQARLRPGESPPFRDETVLGMLGDDQRHWRDHGFGPLVLVECESGAMVGRGGLQWTAVAGRLAIELPWAIASSHWNRGLATEAAVATIEWARELSLGEVVALIRPDNAASRRVAEKAGMRRAEEADHRGLLHLVYRAVLAPPAEERR